MNKTTKSKIILSSLLIAVIFAFALFFATNSFATEETTEVAKDEPISQTTTNTVETPLGDSGMKLVGESKAEDGVDYKIIVDECQINIKTDNWTLSGDANHPAMDNGWKIALDCHNITIKDLTQIDNNTNIFMIANENATPLTINIEGQNNIWTLVADRDVNLEGNGTLNIFGNYNSGSQTGIAGLLVCYNASLTVDGPAIYVRNELNTSAEIPSPLWVDNNLNFNSGKLIVTQGFNIPNLSYAIIVWGKIYIGDDTELFCSGQLQAIYWTSENPFGDASAYKTSENFLTYDKRQQANSPAKLIERDVEGISMYTIGLKDGTTPAKTIYKPNGAEPVPPTPPSPPSPEPGSETYTAPQTGDCPLNGVFMLIAVISGACFATIKIRKRINNRA